MIALTPRLLSVFFLILIIYYAFAIVGLEFFAFKVHPGCCNESWYDVTKYYSQNVHPPNSLNDTDTPFVYYLISFDNILRSYGKWPCSTVHLTVCGKYNVYGHLWAIFDMLDI